MKSLNFLRQEIKRAAAYQRKKGDPIREQWKEIEKTFEFMKKVAREYEEKEEES